MKRTLIIAGMLLATPAAAQFAPFMDAPPGCGDAPAKHRVWVEEVDNPNAACAFYMGSAGFLMYYAACMVDVRVWTEGGSAVRDASGRVISAKPGKIVGGYKIIMPRNDGSERWRRMLAHEHAHINCPGSVN